VSAYGNKVFTHVFYSYLMKLRETLPFTHGVNSVVNRELFFFYCPTFSLLPFLNYISIKERTKRVSELNKERNWG